MVTVAPGARRNWPSVTTRSPATTPLLRKTVWPTIRSTVTTRGATLLSAPITQVIMPCCAGSTALAGADSMPRLDLDGERNLHRQAGPQHLVGIVGNQLDDE